MNLYVIGGLAAEQVINEPLNLNEPNKTVVFAGRNRANATVTIVAQNVIILGDFVATNFRAHIEGDWLVVGSFRTDQIDLHTKSNCLWPTKKIEQLIPVINLPDGRVQYLIPE